MIKKFRLQRKTKKKLNKGLWLYPTDKDGNSLNARPTKNQKDYSAYKKGELRNLFDKRNSRKESKEFWSKLNKEVSVSDEVLEEYVNDIFAEEYRVSSYRTLLEAKDNPKAIIAYYNFINAYNLQDNGESSFGNICCMSVDSAIDLLREEQKIKKKARKKRR
ncbi:hypothetical protein ATE84_1237 [Aquimarina sp. MAR_2010_214]|uniref:hypothetical protein n=1 Tax=Aquimarina sp. MAR_2010_214 TaxID=1250026 RepID=UPI000C6FDF45|nr:hypothetical protein [Aquimarina sp. MAR_2010_214]PKV49217.1 hypothetical protein ATE84_1237 [Aquimarina sp. MAR_2010_214]